jgi:hypothetical protein
LPLANIKENRIFAMGKKHLTIFLFFSLCCCLIISGCSGDEISKIIGGGNDTKTYSVSGTIFATDNSAIDSDVNDSFTSPISNDDFETAQDLPNPAVLGGYVNTTGTGEPGHFYDPEDPDAPGDLNDFLGSDSPKTSPSPST